jgi:hypothetical protein
MIFEKCSSPDFSCVRVARSLVFCVVFCRSFFALCLFFFRHIALSVIYGFWLPLWYLQTLYMMNGRQTPSNGNSFHIFGQTVVIVTNKTYESLKRGKQVSGISRTNMKLGTHNFTWFQTRLILLKKLGNQNKSCHGGLWFYS